MKIIAYSSPDAPIAYRWLAFMCDGAKPGPIRFNGATKEAAVTRAEAFWHAERAKAAARDAAIAERREKARLARVGA